MFTAVNNHASSEFYSFLELQHPVVEKIKVQLPDPCCPLLFTQVCSNSNCVQVKLLLQVFNCYDNYLLHYFMVYIVIYIYLGF